MAKIDLRRLCATILPVNSVVYEFTIIWAKIECFSDGFGYGHRRTQFQLVCILHRRYTQFWHISAKQTAKTADFRHKIRFIIVSEHCPQKTAQTHGQKQLKKCEKNVLHTRYTWAKTHRKKPRISACYTIL